MNDSPLGCQNRDPCPPVCLRAAIWNMSPLPANLKNRLPAVRHGRHFPQGGKPRFFTDGALPVKHAVIEEHRPKAPSPRELSSKMTEGVGIPAKAGYRRNPIGRSGCRQNATPSGASAPPPSEREAFPCFPVKYAGNRVSRHFRQPKASNSPVTGFSYESPKEGDP